MTAQSIRRLINGRVKAFAKEVGFSKPVNAWTRGELRFLIAEAVARRLDLVSYSGIRDVVYWYGLVPRPNYAYGVRYAAEVAKKLGHRGVTVIEMGVAGGNGLVALETHARHYSRAFGIAIDVIGFDRVAGLPEPVDHRDLPYLWSAGDFEMDEAALRRRLRDAALILGDVAETIPRFLDEQPKVRRTHPIGFVALDLDYWSSTASALSLFEGKGADLEYLLPRVLCYFDDVVIKIEDVGQMLAIRDFNAAWSDRTIGRPFGLRWRVPFQPPWADQLFEAHFFEHPDYARHLDPGALQQPLSSP